MVDARVRRELAAALQQLVCGDMTTRQFTCRYCDDWSRSPDAAVSEVAEFGWALYSDDTGPARLGGKYAVSDEDRLVAGRAVLFLLAALEYEWPVGVEDPGPWTVPGVLFFVAACMLGNAAYSVGLKGWLLGLVGLLTAAPAIHWLLTRRGRLEEVRRFQASGDLSVWPFLRSSDLEQARSQAEAGAAPTRREAYFDQFTLTQPSK